MMDKKGIKSQDIIIIYEVEIDSIIPRISGSLHKIKVDTDTGEVIGESCEPIEVSE